MKALVLAVSAAALTAALPASAGIMTIGGSYAEGCYRAAEQHNITLESLTTCDRAFTEQAVKGLTANREKAEGWLAKNAIVVTALNPIIGYAQGAELVKEAMRRNIAIREVAVQKAREGLLKHRDNHQPVSAEEIEKALSDLRRLTESGIA